MPHTSADDGFAGLAGAMFRLILTMDDARSAMGERLGIGVTGLKTISILNREGPSTAGALAAAASITSGSMTATIDKLVLNNLVAREQSSVDRRSVVVDLTDAGRETMAWVISHYYEALSAALPGGDHTAAITQYLESTSDNIHDLAERVPRLPRD